MFQFSGLLSHRALLWILGTIWQLEFSCTRVDIQLTLERKLTDLPLSRVGRLVRRALEENGSGGGVVPKVSIFDKGDEVGESFYVGSRSSACMVRVYDKEVDEQPFIRVECELKQHSAKAFWASLKSHEIQNGTWLWYSLPEHIWALPTLDRFKFILKNVAKEKPEVLREKQDDERTMRWLEEIVGITIGRLAMGEQRNALIKWLDRVRDAV